jgi:hypothetical protein
VKELFALTALLSLTAFVVVRLRRRVDAQDDFHERVWREYRKKHQRQQLIAGARRWN